MSTVVDDPFDDEMPAFFDLDFETFLEAKREEAWLAFERDEIDESEFLDSFFADDRDFDHDAFRDHVRRAYAFVPGMEELLGDLADRGIEMHAFSNYSNWYRLIEQQLELSRFLDWTFVSCETGIRKPDREAYRLALRELDASPTDCIFVDNRRDNCRAAEDVGIPALQFRNAQRLRRRLPFPV